MVALPPSSSSKRKAVRMTAEEARILATAVAISVLSSPPPDCCGEKLDAVMDRIAALFDMEINVNFVDGTVHINGLLVAEKAEDE